MNKTMRAVILRRHLVHFNGQNYLIEIFIFGAYVDVLNDPAKIDVQ